MLIPRLPAGVFGLFITGSLIAPLAARAGDLANVTAIAAGAAHVCALVSGGGVKCWGSNYSGQLGNGTQTTSPQYTPVDVVALSSGVVAISAGGNSTCAVTGTGGVKCWGANDLGQLGDGTSSARNTPGDVVGLSGIAAVAQGISHACALTMAGGVKCWGWNAYGQLGDGTTTDHATPVDVPSLPSGVTAIWAGLDGTCAMTAGGSLKCWGLYTQDGPAFQGAHSATPVAVPGLSTGVVDVALAAASCVVTAAGGAKCWGPNFIGEVGDGTQQSHTTPVDVTGLSSGVARITGIYSGYMASCALTTAGGVKCWGSNERGNAGQGSNTGLFLTPTDVPGLASGVVALTSGSESTCALTDAGFVKCWGSNGSGALGNPNAAFGVPATVTYPAAAQTVSFPAIGNQDVSSAPFDVSASASSGLPVTFSSLSPSVCTVSGVTVTMVSIGMCTIAARQAGSSDFSAAESDRTFRVSGSTASMPTRLANISTRARVGTGDDVLIGGFVVPNGASKTVVITVTGPSLSANGVANVLADPVLSLVRLNGSTVATNDDWGSNLNKAFLQATGLAPSDPRESAIMVTLSSGAYGAVVSGKNGGTGVALVAIYEIDQPNTPLINISTRGKVMTGDDVMIGGFVIDGTASQKVAIVGNGPSMAQSVAGTLTNPMLQLVRMSDGAIIATNDDWGTASNAAELQMAGFAPSDAREPAILITLPPGAYGAILSGVNGTTGVGLVAVYAVP